MLILAILTCGEWPALWMEHWIIPLYKRKSVYQAVNYEGIPFTSQISKIAEKILALIIVPQLIWNEAYERNQFAYMPDRGASDALTHLVITWMLQFGKNKKNLYIVPRGELLTRSTRADYYASCKQKA